MSEHNQVLRAFYKEIAVARRLVGGRGRGMPRMARGARHFSIRTSALPSLATSSPLRSRHLHTSLPIRALFRNVESTVFESYIRSLALRSKEVLSSSSDVSPHLSYFRALIGDDPKTVSLDGETREAYAVELVERYEELTKIWEGFGEVTTDVNGVANESVPELSEVLRSDEAFNFYLRALLLAKTSVSSSEVIALASKRRDSILAHHGVQPVSTPLPSASEGASTTVDPELAKREILKAALSRKKPRLAEQANWAGLGQRLGTGGGEKASAGASAAASSGSGFWSFSNPGKAPGTGINDFKLVIEENKGSTTFRIFRFLGVVTVVTVAGITLMSWMMEHFKFNVAGGAAGARGFATQAPSKHQPNGKSTTTFEDVHGCEEAKEELVEIVEFLKNPVRFTKLGGKMPKGCLLIGPPGTGKTLLARAVAGEAGVQFFFASGAEFDEIFVGVGAARIRELFKQARANSPAIVFIDELDAIGSRRNPRDQQHSKQTLNQLLVELDGFNQTEGIIIIGATNFPEMLDKALTRPGRFDKEVVVPLPDVRGRLNILKHHLKTIKYDRSVDLSTVARGTIGFSGAELQNLVNQAAIKAAVDDQEMVTLRHMNWARDKILMGAERRSAVITPENKLATAYHEGGHALVALFNEHCDPLHQVTVMPRGRALGVTSSLPLMDKMNRSHVEYLARIQMAMGGRAAEKLLYGKENITDGASSDIRNASHVAHTMVRHFGFSDALGPVHLEKDDASISPQTRALIESEVRDIIEDQQTKAYELLEKHRVELDRLANALVEYETLSLEEVKEVIKGVPLLDRKRQLEEAKKLDVKEHDDQVGGDGGLGVIVDGGKEQEPAGLKRDR